MKFIIAILIAFQVLGCSSAQKSEDHNRAMLHLQIGTSNLARGNYPQAMAELLKAEELDPHDPMIMNNLGLAYFVRGKLKLAETKFRAAVTAAPKFTDAKNNLGRVLVDTEHYADALKILHDAEGDLTYEFPEKTYSNLGMAYFGQGDYVQAEEYLYKSLAIRRQSCTTADFYGRTLLELKRMAQSAQVLDQAIEYCRAEHFEEPLYFSAMSYLSLGEKEKSRARLEELLKNYPKSKYVARAKGMLDLLEQ